MSLPMSERAKDLTALGAILLGLAALPVALVALGAAILAGFFI